jgi:hypothetical protein
LDTGHYDWAEIHPVYTHNLDYFMCGSGAWWHDSVALPDPKTLVVSSLHVKPWGVLSTDSAIVSENAFLDVRVVVDLPVEPVASVKAGEDVLSEKSVFVIRSKRFGYPELAVRIFVFGGRESGLLSIAP